MTVDNQSLLGEMNTVSLLSDISMVLNSGENLEKVLKKVLKLVADKSGSISSTLTVFDRKSGEIYVDISEGLSSEQKERGRYLVGEGIIGKVIETGIPVVISRISDEPEFLDRTLSRKNLDKQNISFICVPIKYSKDSFGALSADYLYNDNNNLDEISKLFSIISSMISRLVRLRQSEKEEYLQLREENKRLHQELKGKYSVNSIVGSSKVMQDIYELMTKVAPSNTSVLVRGASGVGKGMVAHAIHYSSNRSEKAFIKVNCAALPESVIESELFGHEEGAFTGAINTRKGRFELADGGTIFLDEIGELSLLTQSKLLRVIQDKELERVGGTETISVDVRIVAATNQDLEKLIEQKKFRQDLYYRLNVFPITVPPLKERQGDILLLIDHFVDRYSSECKKQINGISDSAIDALTSYHWPGNVRELENCIERAVLLCNDGLIQDYHLPPTLQTAHTSGTLQFGDFKTTLENAEREMIETALNLSNGKMSKAAKQLGISERIMGLRVKSLGINPKKYKT